jgi:uncharacterized protein
MLLANNLSDFSFKSVFWVLGLFGLIVMGTALYLGTLYIAPKNRSISPPPPQWKAQSVRFHKNTLSGWYVPNQNTSACILLLHGLNSHRGEIIPIAEFLYTAGFTLFLFDFRGHGESKPDTVTFGLRESEDAKAALQWIRHQTQCQHIGIWGHSMGAAAAVLGEHPLEADAFVLDSMYATIEQATQHRLLKAMGRPAADILSPLLLAQIPIRLHTDYEALHPVEAAKRLKAPTLIIYGDQDQSAYPEEAHAIFNTLSSTHKFIWKVSGAQHGKTHTIHPEAYARKVVDFFHRFLK